MCGINAGLSVIVSWLATNYKCYWHWRKLWDWL